MEKDDKFLIPMKIPTLLPLESLLNMNKDNHYLKNGSRSECISVYRDFDRMYCAKMSLISKERICLGYDLDKAMKVLEKVCETFKKEQSKYKVFDHLSIIYPKERRECNEQ